ncbi:MAG: winged helix-turn-helix domain-containing protein [Spirochaetota bacterium]
MQELIQLYREETDPKAKIRLLAAIYRKEGMTLQEIKDRIKYPLTTIGDWLRRMCLEGISKRYSIKQPGRHTRLTDEQIAELQTILSQSPIDQGLPFLFWTTKLVRDFIEREYGVSYKLRQVRNLFNRLGMSCQKPRPEHMKANKKLQEEFKKTSGKGLNHSLRMDMRSFIWTRASSL